MSKYFDDSLTMFYMYMIYSCCSSDFVLKICVICLQSAALASPMEFNFTEDRAGFSIVLPGWEMEDINIVSKSLKQIPYVRTWRILSKLELIREIAKSEGFMDLCEFEEGQHTYMKCVDLERCSPYGRLLELGGKPYAYDIQVESHVGRIGKTSFQIDNWVSAQATEQKELLYRSSLVYVCLNKEEVVMNLPTWWVDKYRPYSMLKEVKPLHVTLAGAIPKKITEDDDFVKRHKSEYHVVYRRRYQVRHGEVDRFGHTNNTTLLKYCADAVAHAYESKHLPQFSSIGVLENAVNRNEVEFIAGSSLGDTLVASVLLKEDEPGKVFCQLHDNGKLVLAQWMEYNLKELHNVKL